MIDPVAAFLALLYDDTALVAETQGDDRVRIYGSPPGLDDVALNPDTGIPYTSLTVQQAGGNIMPNIPVMRPLFYLIAYGQEGIDAARVLSKVYNVLYHTSGNMIGRVKQNVLIDDRWFMYWAQIESMSAPIIEQKSNWPIAYCTVIAKFDALRGA